MSAIRVQTLDASHARFGVGEEHAQYRNRRKKKAADGKVAFDEHLEQYLVAALRFDRSEYFRRLASNHVSSNCCGAIGLGGRD